MDDSDDPYPSSASQSVVGIYEMVPTIVSRKLYHCAILLRIPDGRLLLEPISNPNDVRTTHGWNTLQSPRHQVAVTFLEFSQEYPLAHSFSYRQNQSTMRSSCVVATPLFLVLLTSNAFAPMRTMKRPLMLLSMNFFQELLQNAFDNDNQLSKDTSKGQLEGPGDNDNDNQNNNIANILTETQRRWREQQQKSLIVTADSVEHTTWTLDLFLSGVPSKDPSNDLYGSKTTISTRDRKINMELPPEPSVSLELTLLPAGVCMVSESPFTLGTTPGQWKLSEDGKQLRFSMNVLGYSRTIQTKGSITKVYWSDQNEVNTSTCTTYNIPPGWLYGDINIAPGLNSDTVVLKGDGILRVEQSIGWLGAASKMVPCGRVSSR